MEDRQIDISESLNESEEPEDLVNDEQENEEDLDKRRLKEMSQVVVTATDWTTETILNQLKKGNIQLSPKYQRRDAWSKKHKSKFIESLFLGLPIPQLILAEQKGSRGKYIVIDGKQRLLSLMQFSEENGESGFEPLKLTGLEIKSELNGYGLLDFDQNPLLYDELTAFQNQTIRTVVVKNWGDEEFLYLLFLRLNTGSVKLSPQELRQALNPGPFIDYVDELTTQNKKLMELLKFKKPDFRMRDVELVIRYYAFRNFLGTYTGDLKSFLDNTCKELNQVWTKDQTVIQSQTNDLQSALEATYQIFGENAFKKWKNNKFEKRFNRAIFDVMVYYFTDKGVAEAAIASKDALVQRFKLECERNPDFLSALESSTKNIHQTFTRFSVWGQIINESLGGNKVSVPKLFENKIVSE